MTKASDDVVPNALSGTEHADKLDPAVAIRILRELVGNYPDRRALVSVLCQTLTLDSEDAQDAIRLGVDRGWLTPDGDPAATIGITERGAAVAARK